MLTSARVVRRAPSSAAAGLSAGFRAAVFAVGAVVVVVVVSSGCDPGPSMVLFAGRGTHPWSGVGCVGSPVVWQSALQAMLNMERAPLPLSFLVWGLGSSRSSGSRCKGHSPKEPALRAPSRIA